jgi:hypothetical protein
MMTTTCFEEVIPSYDIVSWDAETFDDEQLLVICEAFYNQPPLTTVLEVCPEE